MPDAAHLISTDAVNTPFLAGDGRTIAEANDAGVLNAEQTRFHYSLGHSRFCGTTRSTGGLTLRSGAGAFCRRQTWRLHCHGGRRPECNVGDTSTGHLLRFVRPWRNGQQKRCLSVIQEKQPRRRRVLLVFQLRLSAGSFVPLRPRTLRIQRPKLFLSSVLQECQVLPKVSPFSKCRSPDLNGRR